MDTLPLTRNWIFRTPENVDARNRVVYRYEQPFRDGSKHVVLEPLDFMARLAALAPRPRLNLIRLHEVFCFWPN
jgi:hypothetical protein